MPARTIREKKEEAVTKIKRLLQYSPIDEDALDAIVASVNLTESNIAEQRLIHWAIVSVGTNKLREALKWLHKKGSDLDEVDYKQSLRPIQRAILRYACRPFKRFADDYLERVKILVELGVKHDEVALFGENKTVMERVTLDLAGRYPLDLKRLNDALKNDDDESDVTPLAKRRKTDHQDVDDHFPEFNRELLSDVILRVGGQRFFVHKKLLSQRSDYFKAMFEHMKEKTQEEIEVHEVEADVFTGYLQMLYKDKAEAIDGVNPLELIHTLERFPSKLNPSCLYDAVFKSLDAGNVLGALKRAKAYDMQPVVEVCRRYIWTNHSWILQRAGDSLDDDKDAMKELRAELQRAGHYRLVGPCLG